MADHDHGYKLLFSNPEMVENLLRGFVNEPWVGELDFSQQCPKSQLLRAAVPGQAIVAT